MRNPPQTLRSKHALRVGFLGAAHVSRQTWIALHRAGHRVTWIGCRDTQKAYDLIAEILPRLSEPSAESPNVGSYADVVAAHDVDVVYIAIPVALRDAWVQQCAVHGKHIVCEKPAAASTAQLLSWLHALAPQRLLFMDGTMLSHGRRVWHVVEQLKIRGPISHIDVHFSFAVSEAFYENDIRVDTRLEPHGALGDLGWYCIRWILHLVDWTMPEEVSGRVVECAAPPSAPAAAAAAAGPSPSPIEGAEVTPATTAASASLKPDKGRAITAFEGRLRFAHAPLSEGEAKNRPVTATFYCGFGTAQEQTVRVYARDGVVTVHGAINSTDAGAPSFSVRRSSWGTGTMAVESPSVEVFTDPLEQNRGYQIEQLWRDVGDSLVRLGQGEPLLVNPVEGKRWSTYAYATQLVMGMVLDAAQKNAVTQSAVTEDDGKEKASDASVSGQAGEAAQKFPLTAVQVKTGGAGEDAEEAFPFSLF